MNNVKIDFEKSIDIINEIKKNIKLIDSNIGYINEITSDLNTNKIWSCDNAEYLKNKVLMITNKCNKNIELLKINLNIIENKFNSYKKFEKEVLRDFNK